MKKSQLNAGCEWELVKGNDKRRARYCHKLITGDSIYCPKHALMFMELDNENRRRMAHVRMGKQRKQVMREMLETSPLRVVIQ